MPPLPQANSYFNELAQHANALIPALGGSCEEEDGAYLVINEVRRFLFHPARTFEEQKQVLHFINHSLAVGGEYMEEAIILELFTDVYYYNEPFTSLFRDHLSPSAWTLFLTHRELERQRKRFLVAEQGQSRPYTEYDD